MLAWVFRRGMRERHRRPVRIVMARGAIERCRHVVGDFARGGAAVVAALTVGDESRVIEASRAPRQCAVASAAILGGRHVIAGSGSSPDAGVARAAGTSAIDSGPDHHIDVVVLDADRRKRVRRMAGIAVVVARDVARVLAHCLDAVVAAEAGASHLQVIHVNDGQEVVLGVARLAAVLREDVCHRAGS